ncbi:MAG: hypothetical protein FWE74_06050 [Oscillospiraceae bacterium]|nr:hypothetical protein [Oscillospiraceae bacterium]
MALETKMLFKLIGHAVATARSLEEAYFAVQSAANVEGIDLPSYDEYKKLLDKLNNPDQ